MGLSLSDASIARLFNICFHIRNSISTTLKASSRQFKDMRNSKYTIRQFLHFVKKLKVLTQSKTKPMFGQRNLRPWTKK